VRCPPDKTVDKSNSPTDAALVGWSLDELVQIGKIGVCCGLPESKKKKKKKDNDPTAIQSLLTCHVRPLLIPGQVVVLTLFSLFSAVLRPSLRLFCEHFDLIYVKFVFLIQKNNNFSSYCVVPSQKHPQCQLALKTLA
jgi:hypothetical protein